MRVFKFGGASLRSADAVRNVASIIKRHRPGKMIVIVSAMGKTTNLLEKIAEGIFKKKDITGAVAECRQYHLDIAGQLMKDKSALDELNRFFDQISGQEAGSNTYDFLYDQIVSQGEVISSYIVAEYLKLQGLPVSRWDAKSIIRTDENFREGKVDWQLTEELAAKSLTVTSEEIILTQGFIGGTSSGHFTTLGREGSDYSAAILASCLRADSVTIWKDVPGVMSADPKHLPNAVVFDELPFQEAAEMTYYGASVIHPKTIKPLANKDIPLYVKSFIEPDLQGTVIHECTVDSIPPLIVFKENQCLISCKVTDYSFINEQQLSIIFGNISEQGIRINLMQNSAISFSFCIDYREDKATNLINSLSDHFEVYYNTNLTLITIKNYDARTFEDYRKRKGLLLEQSSRSTLQVLVRN